MSGISTVLPCERDEDEETFELRRLIEQFDELFEACQTRVLDSEEERELNTLFIYLQEKENEYWTGVDHNVVEMICEPFAVHFPTIRYNLNMLPDNYSE